MSAGRPGGGFGERVRFYREKRGMSQKELGATVGRGHAMVSMLERGQRQIHVDELLTFAQALGVEPDALLGLGDRDLFSIGYKAGARDVLAALSRHIEELREVSRG